MPPQAHAGGVGTALGRWSRLIVLVADVPDELLEEILERHDPGKLPGAVAHDREVLRPRSISKKKSLHACRDRRVGDRTEPNVSPPCP